MKFAGKQEKTQYYTTDYTKLFSIYDAYYSDEANSERFYAPPCIRWVLSTLIFTYIVRVCVVSSLRGFVSV